MRAFLSTDIKSRELHRTLFCENYLYCPLVSHSFGQPEKRLKKEFSEFEKTIYNLVRENFDLALYIAERKTGIHFSKNLRRSIAEEYAISKGYLYYHANAYNIPWMLLYFHSAIPCFGLTLKRESELWNFLKNSSFSADGTRLKGRIRYSTEQAGKICRRKNLFYPA